MTTNSAPFTADNVAVIGDRPASGRKCRATVSVLFETWAGTFETWEGESAFGGVGRSHVAAIRDALARAEDLLGQANPAIDSRFPEESEYRRIVSASATLTGWTDPEFGTSR